MQNWMCGMWKELPAIEDSCVCRQLRFHCINFIGVGVRVRVRSAPLAYAQLPLSLSTAVEATIYAMNAETR